MASLKDYFDLNNHVLYTDIGVEVELENARLNSENRLSTYWITKADGSLRGPGSREFVFASPLSLTKAIRAANALENSMYRPPICSPRCSTHVHTDMRGINSFRKLGVMTVAALIEPVLFLLVDEERQKSNFCVPLWRTPDRAYQTIGKAVSQGFSVDSCAMLNSKYSSINYRAIYYYGSLEFRMAPAMWKAEDLVAWMTIVHEIWRLGAGAKNTMAVGSFLDEFSLDMYWEMIRSVFKDTPVSSSSFEDSIDWAFDLALSAVKYIQLYQGD